MRNVLAGGGTAVPGHAVVPDRNRRFCQHVRANLASFADHPRGRNRGFSLPNAGTIGPVAGALSHPVMLVLFLMTITQPYSVLLGPILMGPYRLVLIALFFPLFFGWVRGKYGGFILPDFLLIAHVAWMCVSLIVNHQADRFMEYGGAQFFDIFTAYLLGRAAIRSREDFYFFSKIFLAILLFLLPFAFLESTKGMMILQNIFRGLPSLKVFNASTLTYPARLGMLRAQTTINHPIVYGVLSSMGFSLGIVALRYAGGGTGLVARIFWSLGSAGGTFFSLSAGAFTGVAVQGMLIVWNAALSFYRDRWRLLGAISVIVYIILDIVAARPPLLVMARFVAFSGATAWNRYLIWRFGTDEVGRHPIFGMGLFSDWIRAPFMPSSIDNHWLLVAMRWGLPAIVLLLGAYFYIVVRLIRLNLSQDPAACAIRFALVFIYISMFFQMGTVVVWHVTYSLLLVMLGGSVWLFNEPDKIVRVPETTDTAEDRPVVPDHGKSRKPALPGVGTGETPAPPAGQKIAYTRFPTSRRRP